MTSSSTGCRTDQCLQPKGVVKIDPVVSVRLVKNPAIKADGHAIRQSISLERILKGEFASHEREVSPHKCSTECIVDGETTQSPRRNHGRDGGLWRIHGGRTEMSPLVRSGRDIYSAFTAEPVGKIHVGCKVAASVRKVRLPTLLGARSGGLPLLTRGEMWSSPAIEPNL